MALRQDCGQVMPGATMVVIKMDGQPTLCKTDEVGELCLNSSYVGSSYWGLQGITNQIFKVCRLSPIILPPNPTNPFPC